MVLINYTPVSVINMIKWVIDFNTNYINYKSVPELTFYLKLSITTYNLGLFFFITLFILNMLCNFFFSNTSYIMKFMKFLNTLCVLLILNLLFIKFYLALKIESVLGIYLYDIKLNFYKDNNQLNHLEHFVTFSSAFSDAIYILSLLIGIICLDLLGNKNLFKSINNINIFFLFNFFVSIMVSTNNLLIMFISFEFIFLPTVYFAYTLGYVKKINKATIILFSWTLFGSFLVLCTLGYIYYKYNTLNYLFLNKKSFSKFEMYFLFTNILIGFGVKIPLAPLHYWLLKVHVEAPTGFSIFLSGFLVKSALYCLFMLLNIFNNTNLYIILMIWILYSLIVGTFGLARQVDIKKLIAWATIQEMSFMLLLLLFKQLFLTHTCVLFIILHGLMSTYMFYIVDILQRRFKTRSIHFLKGLNIIYPKLTLYIWFLILLFSGFPLTIKFFIEWSLISLLLETNRLVLMVTIFVVVFLGVVFFSKLMFTIIYGSPELSPDEINMIDIQHKEKAVLNCLGCLIFGLLFLVFLIKWYKKKNLQPALYDD